MYTINVIDDSMKVIRHSNLEHNDRNIKALAGTYILELGSIKSIDSDSDCITFVNYEKGSLAFSI